MTRSQTNTRVNNGKSKIMKCLTMLNNYLSKRISILICLLLLISMPFYGIKAQEPLPQDRLLNSQSDTLLQALERALFPPEATLIRIRDYPDCWAYEMEIDTNRLVRLPQPDHRAIGELLLMIAYTKDYRYFEPVMAMYERHQTNFKKEWEDVRKKIKSGCQEKNYQISIMLSMENTLRALEFARDRLDAEDIWAFYQLQRNLDFRVWKNIGSYQENTQTYPFYSEYFREVKRMQYSWFAYEGFVWPYWPFIDLIESKIVQECRTFDISNFNRNVNDTLKHQNHVYFSRNLNTMAEVSSPRFKECLQERFEEFSKFNLSLIEVYEYAQKNRFISERYVQFLLDQLFYHHIFSEFGYEDKENWFKIIYATHTKPLIKPYLMEKSMSSLPSDRALAYAFLVQFPEEDVLDLFLSRARSRHTTEEEMDVLYNNFKRINQGKYFSDKRHDEVRKQIKRMKSQFEKGSN